MIRTKILGIHVLSNKAFAPYGRILVPTSEESPETSVPDAFDFYIVYRAFSGGWQLGYLTVETKEIDRLECHSTTPEAFVPLPLRGEAVLVVSTDPNQENSLHAFRLTKPVVLNAGIWHNVIHLVDGPAILIIENPDVTDSYHELPYIVRCNEK